MRLRHAKCALVSALGLGLDEEGRRSAEGGGATINNGPLGATVQQLGPDNGAWPLPFVVATTTRDTHAPFPIRLWL